MPMYRIHSLLAASGALFALAMAGCAEQSKPAAESTAPPPPPPTAVSTNGAAANAPATGAAGGEAKPAAKAPVPAGTHVTMVTSAGTIELELYPDKAPLTVRN